MVMWASSGASTAFRLPLVTSPVMTSVSSWKSGESSVAVMAMVLLDTSALAGMVSVVPCLVNLPVCPSRVLMVTLMVVAVGEVVGGWPASACASLCTMTADSSPGSPPSSIVVTPTSSCGPSGSSGSTGTCSWLRIRAILGVELVVTGTPLLAARYSPRPISFRAATRTSYSMPSMSGFCASPIWAERGRPGAIIAVCDRHGATGSCPATRCWMRNSVGWLVPAGRSPGST